MPQLIVDTPNGIQELLTVGQGGGYTDPDRVVWDDRLNGPIPDDIRSEIGGLVRVNGQVQYSADRQAQNDAAVLVQAKADKIAQIDARTQELLRQGFPFAGKQFGLDPDTRSFWIGLVIAKDFLTYPKNLIATDGSVYAIPDAVTVVQFYATAVNEAGLIEDGGIDFKQRVNACATKGAVDAVVDDR